MTGASSASADLACSDIKRLRRYPDAAAPRHDLYLRLSDAEPSAIGSNAPSYRLVAEPQQVILGEREATDLWGRCRL